MTSSGNGSRCLVLSIENVILSVRVCSGRNSSVTEDYADIAGGFLRIRRLVCLLGVRVLQRPVPIFRDCICIRVCLTDDDASLSNTLQTTTSALVNPANVDELLVSPETHAPS